MSGAVRKKRTRKRTAKKVRRRAGSSRRPPPTQAPEKEAAIRAVAPGLLDLREALKKGAVLPAIGRRRVLAPSDADEFWAQSMLQCTVEELAALNGVSVDVMKSRLKETPWRELRAQARAYGKVSLRRLLWAMALGGNASVAIFLAKNELGYKNDPPAVRPVVEVESGDGQVVTVRLSGGGKEQEELDALDAEFWVED